ncbi:MAG: YgiQ family radical SAM protein [Candidatus Omnitrophica bacterium CG1_02_44_16]|nr:MAG: YgiQ family radical SAM protein [Candidatus Omnitrophica bacterium CG1_02_44_16]PIY83759.1 MAG: YgiQ family radical SAM protein [Candidatus Omnitrophica bacterium CG_4_10_14_0_8_um_filter_44_12]
MKPPQFLPTNKNEMRQRGWDACDVIFITADAYCDHPSFGVALLSRLLEDEGYKVGIIAQPDWHKNDDFQRLGRPRLFFGITAGNLDSMLNIYTSNMNLRKLDKYSPGGAVGLRPKLPTIVYANKARELFSGVPVVIGGIEASMRRLAHYDFWSDKVKRSILFDSKADMLIYGMGERQVSELARRLKKGEVINNINDIRGTAVARKDLSFLEGFVTLPSFEEVVADKHKFLEAFKLYSGELGPFSARPVVQKVDTRFCVQLAPAQPLTTEELDRIYALKFTRLCHPRYEAFGGVPALKTVDTSITSHRGCAASCSFCSLSLHQGRVIQSRSAESIVREAKDISSQPDFKGVISDVGGPTANMYAATCAVKNICERTDCLWPKICPNFKIGCAKQLEVLRALRSLKGVKQVNIQSGVRYDLLLLSEAKEYFKELCSYHVSGQLKVAPEHVSDKVLHLMRKPAFKVYEEFVKAFDEINGELGSASGEVPGRAKKQYLVQYFITAHPGCDAVDAHKLALFTKKMGYTPEQIQDFIPLPMTRSSVMYYTGLDPETGKPLYVPKGRSARSMQREAIQGT